MQNTTTPFKAQDFCSRKLLQLVSDPQDTQMSDLELRSAIEELAQRRHYLEQLQQLGALSGH